MRSDNEQYPLGILSLPQNIRVVEKNMIIWVRMIILAL